MELVDNILNTGTIIVTHTLHFIFSVSIMFQYFVKIVPTTYVKLNGDVSTQFIILRYIIEIFALFVLKFKVP